MKYAQLTPKAYSFKLNLLELSLFIIYYKRVKSVSVLARHFSPLHITKQPWRPHLSPIFSLSLKRSSTYYASSSVPTAAREPLLDTSFATKSGNRLMTETVYWHYLCHARNWGVYRSRTCIIDRWDMVSLVSLTPLLEHPLLVDMSRSSVWTSTWSGVCFLNMMTKLNFLHSAINGTALIFANLPRQTKRLRLTNSGMQRNISEKGDE